AATALAPDRRPPGGAGAVRAAALAWLSAAAHRQPHPGDHPPHRDRGADPPGAHPRLHAGQPPAGLAPGGARAAHSRPVCFLLRGTARPHLRRAGLRPGLGAHPGGGLREALRARRLQRVRPSRATRDYVDQGLAAPPGQALAPPPPGHVPGGAAGGAPLPLVLERWRRKYRAAHLRRHHRPAARPAPPVGSAYRRPLAGKEKGPTGQRREAPSKLNV
ncbi:MAG: Protein-methionine-sulfoxide reductase heme-binding subunit MsrQ, partial [uncultured Chloroflexi bacterium]